MKTTLVLLLSFLSASSFLIAQIITVDPAFPTRDDTVTITYDATQGSAGLIDVYQVYAHTGVITESGGPGNWQYVQGNWGTDDPRVKMTNIGNNLHQIRYHLDDYYGAPEAQVITEMAFVFRNVDGSREGKTEDLGDIFTPVYLDNDEFRLVLISPSPTQRILSLGDSVQVQISASRMADLALYEGPTILAEMSGTMLDYTYHPATTGNVTLTYTAEDDMAKYLDGLCSIGNKPWNRRRRITRRQPKWASGTK